MSNLSGFMEMLDRDAAKRKAYIASWNAQYAPLQESTDPETGVVTGVFLLERRWYFGDKYANGYHPEKLTEIPPLVVCAIIRTLDE